jgi:hypothetical protein
MYALAAMPTLEKLDLSGCATLSGIVPLQGHRALRELNVSRTLVDNLQSSKRSRVYVSSLRRTADNCDAWPIYRAATGSWSCD